MPSAARRSILTQVSHTLASFCFIFLTSLSEFVSPAAVRAALNKERGNRYKSRKFQEQERTGRKDHRKLEEDPLAVSKVFA